MSSMLSTYDVQLNGDVVLTPAVPTWEPPLILTRDEVAGMAEASGIAAAAFDPHYHCHCQGPLDACCSPLHGPRP